MACIIWVDKAHFVAIDLNTKKQLLGKEAARVRYQAKNKAIASAAYVGLHSQLDPSSKERLYFAKLHKLEIYDAISREKAVELFGNRIVEVNDAVLDELE